METPSFCCYFYLFIYFQSLGSSNAHAVSAVVDDRLPDKKFLRLLTVGLHPGFSLHCLYDCPSPPVNKCSSPSTAVVLLAGNASDYVEGRSNPRGGTPILRHGREVPR